MTSEPADVLIIGGGASGGVAALRLAEAGFRVVCLEQGDWVDPSGYPGTRDEWELLARGPWAGAPNLRKRPADYPLDLSAAELGASNFNAVGGSTILYAGVWPRLLPSDFRVRSRDGVADDWPISYDDLVPYYERVDRAFGVAGLGGNPSYPPGADPPLPPLPIGEVGLRVARAHAACGWHWWPESLAIASDSYDGRHACVQRGTCMSGCNEGAKASTDLTHWPKAIALGAELITGARVRRVTVDARGRAAGAEWIDREGREHFTAADVVLLAANGIGTPRLLLNSACSAFPGGLANRSGLVGRRLMGHPSVLVHGYFDDDPGFWHAPAGGVVQSLQFYESDSSRGFVRGAKWTLAPTGGPITTALRQGRDLSPFGAGHHEWFAERFGRGATWIVLCEDLPNPDNRVELSSSLVDSDGIPAPKLTFTLHGNTRALIEWHTQRAIESLTAAGARITEAAVAPSNAHHMGTARMGDDPASSVVDRWCLSHDVPNLGIVDGSVFVTGGAVNPTPTIAALALRAAEHLVGTRASVPTPARPFTVAVSSAPSRAVARPVAPRPTFDADQRRRLAALADQLIPAGPQRPVPSSIGVHTTQLDRVLAARPDLAKGLARAVEYDSPAALAAADGSALDALLLAVVGGYYLHPDVRAAVGYAGQQAIPVPAHDYPAYLSEGLLDHMVG